MVRVPNMQGVIKSLSVSPYTRGLGQAVWGVSSRLCIPVEDLEAITCDVGPEQLDRIVRTD